VCDLEDEMVKDAVVAKMIVKKITQKKLLMIFILKDKLLRNDIKIPSFVAYAEFA